MADKAIFLDQDGTLIEDVGYISEPDQVKLHEGVAEALKKLKQMGYKLIVVTNQSSVARGITTESKIKQIHTRLRQELAKKSVRLDKIYYCPYHPDGTVKKYTKESELRKPNPGMLTTAAKDRDIDLSQSWMLGNSYRDVAAGSLAGCRTILINSPLNYKNPKPGDVAPDHQAVNIKEAVNIIKSQQRFPERPTRQVEAMPATEQDETSINNQPQQQPTAQTTAAGIDGPGGDSTEQLLREILKQMKDMQRAGMFDEFSELKMLAGVLQIIVLFCLLASIWFLLAPGADTSRILVSLGFAGVFQLMSLTLYIMHSRR